MTNRFPLALTPEAIQDTACPYFKESVGLGRTRTDHY